MYCLIKCNRKKIKCDALTNVHNSKDNISKEFLCFHLFSINFNVIHFLSFGSCWCTFYFSSSLCRRSQRDIFSSFSSSSFYLKNLPLFNDVAHLYSYMYIFEILLHRFQFFSVHSLIFRIEFSFHFYIWIVWKAVLSCFVRKKNINKDITHLKNSIERSNSEAEIKRETFTWGKIDVLHKIFHWSFLTYFWY